MTLRITNQKTITYPEKENLIDFPFDKNGSEYIEAVQEHFQSRFVNPLFESINQREVKIESVDDKGKATPIERDEIIKAIDFESAASTFHFELQEELNEIYLESSAHHIRSEVAYSQQGLVQLFARHNLPLPSSTIVYRPYMDVIPHAQKSLVDWQPNIELFSTGIASVIGFSRLHDNHLFVHCRDSDVYEKMVDQILAESVNAPANKMASIQKVKEIKMNNDLTTTWVLPTSGVNTNVADYSDYSLWRLAEKFILEAESKEELYVPNFNFNAYKTPNYITFVNVDAHASTNDQYITKEYEKLIQIIYKLKAMKGVPIKKLIRAEKMDFDSQSNSLDQELQARNENKDITRRSFRKLNGKAYSHKQQIKMIQRIIKRQHQVTLSKNTYVTKRATFNRANRREPFNLNKKGIKKHTSYRPDIHIYTDTSGSISEKHYKTSVFNIIQIAKLAKVNIYFSSFSHIISEPVFIQTKGRSAGAIYKEIMQIPKVSGGTDFENVWKSIEVINKKEQSPRTNFIISDMEYYIRKGRIMQPGTPQVDNTYYIPINVAPNEYSFVKRCAERLIKGLIHNGHKNARNYFVM
ncbi:hypothetical protein [Kurthia sibirica]|uniref:Uncharacterized protein n=1 Tax=Kurthia sibirica TaxID=202750 RepID=A0A2U3AKG1_9BACL|nr:hypothetical protein [Kurthia sibirica]PWI25012.1 hypothetical protein DEX24_10585 [Kurthia sibirica]GEK33082.1 hypothetical protein KSI01_06150 [Kurthia sibirica]